MKNNFLEYEKIIVLFNKFYNFEFYEKLRKTSISLLRIHFFKKINNYCNCATIFLSLSLIMLINSLSLTGEARYSSIKVANSNSTLEPYLV